MVCTKTGEGRCGRAAFCESGSRTLFPDDRSQGGPESSKLLEAPSLDQPWRSPASPLREARGNCSSRRSISLAIQGPKLDDERSHRQSPRSVCTASCVSSTVTCAVCIIATARGAEADAGGALPRPPLPPAAARRAACSHDRGAETAAGSTPCTGTVASRAVGHRPGPPAPSA